MEFTVEFYETSSGKLPGQGFLLKLQATDPNDFAAIAAGLEKLRYRQYHREPLSKALGDGLFELRHVGKLNTRIHGSSEKAAGSLPLMAYVTKARPFQRATSTLPASACATGLDEVEYEKDELRSISGGTTP